MAKINKDDIRGYWIGEELVCTKCIEADDQSTQEQLLLARTIDAESDFEFYCDRCNEQIE